jgi:hypothetical protein
MKVLFLTQNDARGASTRLRVCQFLEPLARRGIVGTLRPLPLGMAVPRSRAVRGGLYALQALRRVADVPRVRRFDVVVIQRDMIAHAPVIEEAMARTRLVDLTIRSHSPAGAGPSGLPAPADRAARRLGIARA